MRPGSGVLKSVQWLHSNYSIARIAAVTIPINRRRDVALYTEKLDEFVLTNPQWRLEISAIENERRPQAMNLWLLQWSDKSGTLLDGLESQRGEGLLEVLSLGERELGGRLQRARGDNLALTLLRNGLVTMRVRYVPSSGYLRAHATLGEGKHTVNATSTGHSVPEVLQNTCAVLFVKMADTFVEHFMPRH